jgi:hypothetical protein
MAKGRKKVEVERKEPVVDSTGNITFSPPETFGDSLGESLFSVASEMQQIAASLDYPNRLNRTPLATQSLTTLYQQIDKGVLPFSCQGGGGSDHVDVRIPVELCQKAYFNVAIVKNTIDTMTEFSNSELFFKGGNEKSRKFFTNWYYNKIGGCNLADRWLREWFRSCNVPVYRVDGNVDAAILKKIGQIYGAESKAANLTLPIRYVIMNPANLQALNGLSFINGIYYYFLGPYECMRITNPITEEDKEFRKSLPADVVKDAANGQARMPLDPSKTYMFFCKKQDYEPFAMPMFFPVLSDIDLKLTFKGVERVLARTVEYVTLLIKIGSKEEGNNPMAHEAMKELMRNETLGRVLVCGWDTTMEYVIPDINKVLGPEKYKQVNEDIANGLFQLFSSGDGDKFSSTSIKVKVFVEKLAEARRAFLEFINSEVRRIAQDLGFKNFPVAKMAELDLTDENSFQKVILQLAQLNIITPGETLEALKTNYLPDETESLESQKIYKQHRDKGLYEPLLGQKKEEEGRPGGAKAPQTTKKVSPVGTSKSSEEGELFDLDKITEVLKNTNTLYANLEKEVKKQFKVKNLSESQKEAVEGIMHLMVANEDIDNWDKVAKEYVKEPKPIKNELAFEIDRIAGKFNVSTFLASVLIHCRR